MRSTALPRRYNIRPVKITMYLGCDNIIKLKFLTHFDRCTILNVLRILILDELIYNYKLVRCNIERTADIFSLFTTCFIYLIVSRARSGLRSVMVRTVGWLFWV